MPFSAHSSVEFEQRIQPLGCKWMPVRPAEASLIASSTSKPERTAIGGPSAKTYAKHASDEVLKCQAH